MSALALVLSGQQVHRLWETRADLVGLRAGAARMLQIEAYAHQLEAQLQYAFDHALGLPFARSAELRQREVVNQSLAELAQLESQAIGATPIDDEGIRDLRDGQLQVEHHVGRAFELIDTRRARDARRVLGDELEFLVSGRVLDRIDALVRAEREGLAVRNVRAVEATRSWLWRPSGIDIVEQRLLPAVSLCALVERTGRGLNAELRNAAMRVAGSSPEITHLAQTRAEVDAGLAAMGRLSATVSNATVADALADFMREARVLRARNEALFASGTEDDVHDRYVALSAVFETSLRPRLRELTSVLRTEIDDLGGLVAGAERFLLVIALAFGAVAIVLCLGAPILLVHNFSQPLTELVDAVRRFQEGELEARPQVEREDELGTLGRWFGDVTRELQEWRGKAESLTLYHVATGLPNRQLFEERLHGALLSARLIGREMGVISIGIKGFEQLEQNMDRVAGDELLREIAARLRRSVRFSDVISPGAMEEEGVVSHHGSDEFTILLSRVSRAQDAEKVAERILRDFVAPFDAGLGELVIGVYIGIAMFPMDGAEAEQLVRNARAAMRHAMRRGSNPYQFYSEAMNAAAARKMHIRTRLSTAIERGDLSIMYQPLRSTRTGRIAGGEALLRWDDSEMGPVPPSEFIPIAEESGLIVGIGSWVLHQVCDQLHQWQEAGLEDVRIAINVSAHQLQQENWGRLVAAALQEADLSCAAIDLEITETAIMEDDPQTISSLQQLDEMGVRIVLDDFGTGYSSLSYLQRFPISAIKIDRSFVSGIVESSEGAALAEAILAMAKSLGKSVVAEGVETREQADFLLARGCDELQGYLISRAVSARDFSRLLQQSKPEESED